MFRQQTKKMIVPKSHKIKKMVVPESQIEQRARNAHLQALDAITHESLHIDCVIDIREIHNVEMRHGCNDHVYAEIVGITSTAISATMAKTLVGQEVAIRRIDEDGNMDEYPIFHGVITNISVRCTAGYFVAAISAASATWIMDTQPQNRSFQNLEDSYINVMDATGENQGAQIIYHFDDMNLEYPLIRYQETDWEFLRRIASHFEVPLVAHALSSTPTLYVGRPQGQSVGDLSDIPYTISLDQRYFSLAKGQGSKRPFFIYTIASNNMWAIGDFAAIDGYKVYIFSRRASLIDGTLVFEYDMGHEQAFKVNREYNQRLHGVSILGIVLETEAEKLKLHLEIDEEQDVGTAFNYTWRPESGNIMYCMPEVDTIARLYFPSADESTAHAINNLRTNGQVLPDLENPEERFLTTDYRMRMRFNPELFEFLSLISGSRLALHDENGCSVRSTNRLRIQAKETVTVHGQNVSVTAPQEITAVKKDVADPTVINLCYDVDTCGGTARFVSTRPSIGNIRLTPTSIIDQLARYDTSGLESHVLGAVPIETGPQEVVQLAVNANILV